MQDSVWAVCPALTCLGGKLGGKQGNWSLNPVFQKGKGPSLDGGTHLPLKLALMHTQKGERELRNAIKGDLCTSKGGIGVGGL